MSTKILSKYNPLFPNRSLLPVACGSTLVQTFHENVDKEWFNFDITTLLDMRVTMCRLCEEFNIGNYSMERFTDNTVALLNKLQVLDSKDELYWEYVHVLEELIVKVSSVRECRVLLTEHYKLVSEILECAAKNETALLQSKNIQSISKRKYTLLHYFFVNKFMPSSEFDDEYVMTEALKQCFNSENPDINLFMLLSLYKNCDRYDLTWEDLINEYVRNSSEKIDYYWIYTPYVLKYRQQILDILLSISGDDIYDYWLGYVCSGQLLSDYAESSLNTIKTMLSHIVNKFELSGVYPYDHRLIIDKITKERGDTNG